MSLSPVLPLLNHIFADVDGEEDQEQEQGDCTILPPVRVAGYPGSVRIPARARIAEDLQAEEELRAAGVDPVRGPDIPLLSEEEAVAGNKAAVVAGEPAASRRRMRVAHGASDLFSNAQVIFGYPRGRAEDAALAWVCHQEEFELRPVRPNMVLLCLVRELLINALDAGSRTGDMTRLLVRCTSKKFSVWNDGADVAVQRMADVLDPCAELGGAEDPHLFSVEYLFTCPSSSQNEHHRQRGDRSAGHNGLGTKAVCAFSDRVEVNVCDGQHEYFQQFLYNLRRKTEPQVCTLSFFLFPLRFPLLFSLFFLACDVSVLFLGLLQKNLPFLRFQTE